MKQAGKTIYHTAFAGGVREYAFTPNADGTVRGGVYYRRDKIDGVANAWVKRTLKAEFRTVAGLEAYLTAKGARPGVGARARSLAMLQAGMDRGAFDLRCGCTVEPDGRCYHGNESPLLAAGLI